MDREGSSAAVVTFQRKGAYSVRATVDGSPIKKKDIDIANPPFRLECLTDPGDRRPNEPVAFAVTLEHTTTGLKDRDYTYA